MTIRHARALSILSFIVLALPPAQAQQLPMPLPTPPDTTTTPADPASKLPAYDVVSVKQNKSGAGSMSWRPSPDGFTCTNAPLKSLVGDAYGIRWDLISGGPGWVDSAGFDIQAKVAGEDVAAYKKLTFKQRNSLLQALLADRFHLKVQQVSKVLPMYDLVVAKGGPKLKPIPPDDASTGSDSAKAKPHGMILVNRGDFKGQGISLKLLADNLSGIVQHTVVDKTGLTGEYDINLKWASEEPVKATADPSADPGVSIFTAVQEQLGLKLQSTKGPTETLVIEHAELPSQN